MSNLGHFQQEYDLLSEKIHRLRMALAIETDAAVKFKLEKQIEEAEAERNRIEQQLSGAEKLAVKCPYRGLFAFREEDERFFFGRETYTEKLVEAVQKQTLIAVIGASGSGKSSLVYAGLIPRLRRGEFPSWEGQGVGKKHGNWLISSFRPGHNPFQSLAKSLIPFLYTDELERLSQTKKLAEQLQSSEISLSDVFARIIEKDGQAAKFLLFADQFEELYTLCQNDDERRRSLDELLSLLPISLTPHLPITVILTLRADFLGKALAYRPFADAFQNSDIVLGPMNRDELRETIERPAKALDVEIEDGLTDRILDAVGDEPGNLPLLEFALTELWKRQTNGILTHAAYDDIGGVEQALAAYAEHVYTNLTPDEQTRTQRIFTQLVRPGEGTEDTRRIAARADIGEENWELVAKLADARLVVTGTPVFPSREGLGVGSETEKHEDTVEVVHESLITGWQQLREWMDTDREFRMWQERLRFAMHQWVTSNRDEGALLRGAPLEEAEQWLEQRRSDPNQDEQHFIETSVQLRDREVRARRKLRQRITIGLVVGLIIAVVLALFAAFQWNESEKQRQIADKKTIEALKQKRVADEQKQQADEARQKAEINAIEVLIQTSRSFFLSHNEAGALLIAIKAGKKVKQTNNVPPTLKSQIRFNLLELIYGSIVIYEQSQLHGHQLSIASVTFSPDGTLLASGSYDNTIKLWNVKDSSEAKTLYGHSHKVWSVSFNPDGTLLASGSTDGIIKLWNIASGKEIKTLQGHSRHPAVLSVAFSPDGTLLASGSGDGTIKLWQVSDGKEIKTLKEHSGRVLSVAFSPDGTLLASGSKDKTIKLWNVSDGREVKTLEKHSALVWSVAFSPDGTLLASGSEDKTIKLWKVEDGEEIKTLPGHSNSVVSVAFHPDGTMLMSGSADHTVKLWNVADGSEVKTLHGHSHEVWSVMFSPDGTLFASGGYDNTIRLWSIGGKREFALVPITLSGHSGAVNTIDFSPDGTLLASGSGDRTIKLWNISDNLEIRTLHGHSGSVNSVVFNPNGTLLASGSGDGTIKLWNVFDGQKITTIQGHSASVHSISFSPDGTLLASGSADNTIKLWSVSDGKEIKTLQGHSSGVLSVAFSPDGNLLVSGSAAPKPGSRTIKLWNIANGTEITTLPVSVNCVVFSPDGTLLASGSEDKTIKLWNAASGQNVNILYGHSDPIHSVVFSPGGKVLASGNGTVRYFASVLGKIKLWNVADGREIITLEREGESSVYSVTFNLDGSLLASGHIDSTIKIWNLDLESLVVSGCGRLHGYLKNHPNVSEEDRGLCDDILGENYKD